MLIFREQIQLFWSRKMRSLVAGLISTWPEELRRLVRWMLRGWRSGMGDMLVQEGVRD